MSLAINITDAVTSELNDTDGTVFSQPLVAQRMLLPQYELADLKDLRVTVVPRGVEISGATRATSQYEIAVDIGIQKKIGKNTDTDVTTLLGLVDEIADFLKRRPLAAAPWAAWVKTDNDPIYAPNHLAEKRLFTAVLTLTYRVLK